MREVVIPFIQTKRRSLSTQMGAYKDKLPVDRSPATVPAAAAVAPQKIGRFVVEVQ
ncbi:hypothetical protein CCP3SC15_5920002 [Gammaproteobacteria bacterium]